MKNIVFFNEKFIGNYAPLVLVLCSLFIYVLCGGITIWDGGSMLAQSLNEGEPMVNHGRYSFSLLAYPVILASLFTDDVKLLEFLYGALYSTFVIFSIYFTIRLTENSIRARLVALCGILLTALPGQMQQYNEAGILIQVTIPLAIYIASLGRQNSPVILFALCAFMFFAHPISAISFVFFSCLFLYKFYLKRKFCDVFFAFFIGGISIIRYAVTFLTMTEYERTEMQFSIWKQHFYSAVYGLPLIVVFLSFIIIVITMVLDFLYAKQDYSRYEKILLILRFSLLSLIAGLFFIWAADIQSWYQACDYRRFIFFFGLPAAAIATFLHFRSQHVDYPPHSMLSNNLGILTDGSLCILIGLIFSVVLTLQSFDYYRLRNQISDSLINSQPSFLTINKVKNIQGTPLAGWHFPYNSLLMQGRNVKHVVWPNTASVAELDKEHLDLFFMMKPLRKDGWFNFTSYKNSMKGISFWSLGPGLWGEESIDSINFSWARSEAVLDIMVDRVAPSKISLHAVKPFGKHCVEVEILVNLRKSLTTELCPNNSFVTPTLIAKNVVLNPGFNRLTIRVAGGEGQFSVSDSRSIAFGLMLPPEINSQN